MCVTWGSLIVSVDSRLPKLRPYDLDAFFALVEEAHAEYPAEKLDSLYDSKMRVCKAILSANPPGNNDHKMPRHGDVYVIASSCTVSPVVPRTCG